MFVSDLYQGRVRGEFHVVLVSSLDCKELKSELCDLAKKYRCNLDSGVGIEKIMEEIESARTINGLIKVFILCATHYPLFQER